MRGSVRKVQVGEWFQKNSRKHPSNQLRVFYRLFVSQIPFHPYVWDCVCVCERVSECSSCLNTKLDLRRLKGWMHCGTFSVNRISRGGVSRMISLWPRERERDASLFQSPQTAPIAFFPIIIPHCVIYIRGFSFIRCVCENLIVSRGECHLFKNRSITGDSG